MGKNRFGRGAEGGALETREPSTHPAHPRESGEPDGQYVRALPALFCAGYPVVGGHERVLRNSLMWIEGLRKLAP